MYKIIWIFFLVFNFSTSFSYGSLAYNILPRRSYRLNIGMLYSVTQSTYGTNKEELELSQGSSFSLIDVDFLFSYVYTKKIEFETGGIFRRVENKENNFLLENKGIESFNFGVRYLLSRTKKYYYALKGKYKFTPYQNKKYSIGENLSSNEIALGDSGHAFELGVIAYYSFSNEWKFKIDLAYHSPANELSGEIPYSLGIVKSYKSLLLSLGIDGIESLQQDSYKDNPLSKPRNATGLTLRFNSINRSYISPFIELGILFHKKYLFSFKASKVISGVSTDKTVDFSLNFSWAVKNKKNGPKAQDLLKEYILESTIIKVSSNQKFIKIDKGLIQGIFKGGKVDIYKVDFFGGNILVGTGIIHVVKVNYSIIKLKKKYKKIEIKDGFIARLR